LALSEPIPQNHPAPVERTPQEPTPISMRTAEDRSLDSDRQALLEQHNEYRATHGAPALQLDSTLNADAQAYAEKLLSGQASGHDEAELDAKSQGENLYWGWGSRGPPATTDASVAWYEEVNNPGYDFNNPGFSSGTGHFTQLVWVASTKVGFGVASDGNQKHVVARYSPRGNFGGNADYEANVLPAGSTGTDGGSSGGSGSGSGGSSTCVDINANGFCQDQFKWACNDGRYSSWFVPDCQKLCGQCGGSDADAGGSCEDGPDPENWCHDVNSWACTNPTYQDYFTTNCQKLCGSC